MSTENRTAISHGRKVDAWCCVGRRWRGVENKGEVGEGLCRGYGRAGGISRYFSDDERGRPLKSVKDTYGPRGGERSFTLKIRSLVDSRLARSLDR